MEVFQQVLPQFLQQLREQVYPTFALGAGMDFRDVAPSAIGARRQKRTRIYNTGGLLFTQHGPG